MVSSATSNHAAKIQEIKFVPGRHSCRHIADETFQRAPPAEHAE
jgi:hypothetical protein